MVRLQSDRWYSAHGQGRSRTLVGTRTSGSRRLVSLCFLLALVVLLMQKAADPKYVSSAFRSVGVPLEPNRTAPFATQTDSTTPAAATPDNWPLTCADLVPRLLADANDQQIRLLASLWFAVPTQQQPSPDSVESPVADASMGFNKLKTTSLAKLDSLVAEFTSDDRDWLTQLLRFREQWIVWCTAVENRITSADGESIVRPPLANVADSRYELDGELKRTVSAYLDERLIDSLTDAAPWSPRESTAFWRLIQRGQGKSIGSKPAGDSVAVAPKISTLQLESEAAVFKGKSIRFRGSVRRLEFVQRINEAIGVNGYWLAWARGDDNSAQPVAIYGTASGFEVIDRALSLNEGFPEIEVLAIVGKRLAYASQAGVQVAPTLFATGLDVLSLPAKQEPQVKPWAWQRDLTLALAGGVVLAGLICTSILRGRRDATRRKPRARKTTISLLSCALLLGFHSCGLAQPSSPPWAESDQTLDQLQTILGSRMQSALRPDAIDKLRSFLDSGKQEFPVETLQAMHVLNQVGWQRAIDLGLTSDAGEIHLRPVSISGIVSSAELVLLAEAQRAWFQRHDKDQLYQLRMQVDSLEQSSEPPFPKDALKQLGNGTELPVLCQQIPKQWRNTTELRQPIHVSGFGIFESLASNPTYILANGVEWVLPATGWNDFRPSVPGNLGLLGKLGWNLGFADLVAENNQQPLRDSESAAFYSMLNLLDSRTAASTVSQSDGLLGPLDTLAEPARCLGQAVRWPVRLVSCSIVQVESAEDRKTLGAERYFQFDGFVDMGNQRVRYQIDRSRPADDLVFEREFPVTLVMKGTSEFTPRKELTADNQSWPVGRFAEVEGCFYRLWSFESELLQHKKPGARQAAPLVMATRLRPSYSPARPASATEIGWFGYALCFATMLILAAILISVARTQRSVRRN